MVEASKLRSQPCMKVRRTRRVARRPRVDGNLGPSARKRFRRPDAKGTSTDLRRGSGPLDGGRVINILELSHGE